MPKATLSLQKTYLDLIKSGKKTIDGRINHNPLANLKPGDSVKFIDKEDPTNFAICAITRAATYPTFKAMLEKEGLDAMLPGVKSLEEGVKIYNSFPGYAQEVKTHGVLALELMLLAKKNHETTKVAHALSKKKAGQL